MTQSPNEEGVGFIRDMCYNPTLPVMEGEKPEMAGKKGQNTIIIYTYDVRKIKTQRNQNTEKEDFRERKSPRVKSVRGIIRPKASRVSFRSSEVTLTIL